MEYKIKPTSNGREIALSGRMTFADHASFREMISMFDEPGIKKCVFDLSGSEYADSAALGMLLLARDTAAGKGISLVLKGAKGQVKRIMEVAKFGALFTIEE